MMVSALRNVNISMCAQYVFVSLLILRMSTQAVVASNSISAGLTGRLRGRYARAACATKNGHKPAQVSVNVF